MKTYFHTKACVWAFRTLFVTAKNWKQPRYLFRGEWFNRLARSHPGKLLSSDTEGTSIRSTAWMDLSDIMLSETSQSQEVCMIPFTSHSWNEKSYGNRRQIRGCQGLRSVEEVECDYKGAAAGRSIFVVTEQFGNWLWVCMCDKQLWSYRQGHSRRVTAETGEGCGLLHCAVPVSVFWFG